MVKKHKKEQDDQIKTDGAQRDGEPVAANEQETGNNEFLEKLTEKEKEATANYDKYLRAVAELDNYKKRAAREKEEIIKFGKEDVVKDILPFIDSLDRALEHAETAKEAQNFKDGLKLIQDQLLACLKKHGVERIECSGRDFDPNYHEAMLQVDSEHHEDNKVVNEFERGYILNGRLIRPAKVSVCKKKNNNGCEQIPENGG